MEPIHIAIITGFLSSLHCVGMCGPIIAGYVAHKPISIEMPTMNSKQIIDRNSISYHLMYHIGRVLSYTLLGTIAGFLGAALTISSTVQSVVTILLGLFMILFGLSQVGILKLHKNTRMLGTGSKILSGLSKNTRIESCFLLGLMTPLLPCGLLYGMLAVAAATDSPMTGALTMGAFALGTIPALLLSGVLVSTIRVKFSVYGTRFAVVMLIVMGLLTIGRGTGYYHGGSILYTGQDTCCQSSHLPH